MTGPRVFPDVERPVVDYLTQVLAGRDPRPTVAAAVPSTWTTSSAPHVQVAHDGTPVIEWPVAARSTVRVTAWASSTTEAKALANLCLGLLAVHPGAGGIAHVRPLTGVLPARDPDTRAPLASITVRVTTRSISVA